MVFLNSSPERATQMVRLAVDEGADYEQLLEVLFVIKNRDKSLADSLFRYALSKTRSGLPKSNLTLGSLAPYVFADFKGRTLGRESASVGERAQSTTGLIAEYLNTAYANAIAQLSIIESGEVPSSNVTVEYWIASALLPYFDWYMPDKAAEIRGRLNRLGNKVSRDEVESIEALVNPLGVQDLESKAEKASGALKDSYYTQAAIQKRRCLWSRTSSMSSAGIIWNRISERKRWRRQSRKEISMRPTVTLERYRTCSRGSLL
jgi:hypothetical protein